MKNVDRALSYTVTVYLRKQVVEWISQGSSRIADPDINKSGTARVNSLSSLDGDGRLFCVHTRAPIRIHAMNGSSRRPR